MMKRLILMLPVGLLLAGCASLNQHFDCPQTAGVNCLSLDEVNTKVNQGQLPVVRKQHIQNRADQNHPDREPAFTTYPIVESFHQGDPVRYGEKIQRIWVAPYVDTNDNYHQASISYEIIDPGHWLGSPVKAVRE